MRLKCCGLKYSENAMAIDALGVDFVGFIFYPGSSRYVKQIPKRKNGAKRVGVFVNETPDNVIATCKKYDLDYAQLHGNETPKTLNAVAKEVKTIKAFSVNETFDFNCCRDYSSATYFLFDTKGKKFGGNGVKFNWKILENYTQEKPFLLSGGIGPDDVKAINELDHPKLYGIDVNSAFESSPGVKKTELLKEFKSQLK
ncbi:MAG: phosphoribosylanthranilate isomerase [Crocinitomicaceae bacterium]|nr:phosphoribosylanthranilate isomerase [Crocinitomicaceae bacterium]